MKKLLALSLLALAAVSCGTKEASDSSDVTVFALHNGKTLDPEFPVFKKAAELTGVTLKNVASQNQTDETQAFNIMLSSQPLPDLISTPQISQLENLGMEGGVIELDELIEQHAPNIKKFFDEHPRLKRDAVAVNGKIYTIPNYYDLDKIRTSLGYFIRMDWLEKLNLKVPTNVEELHNVLVAFKTKDPNGNGKQDEVPFFTRGSSTAIIIQALVDMFQASKSYYEDNGQLVAGPVQENYKNAVATLAKWYKEGLIDKEIFTRGMVSRDYLLSNNLGGMTADWIASTSSYNGNLKDKIPGFDFSIMLPIKYNGKSLTRHTRPTYEGGVSISKDAKDPVKLIKYLDFWYTPEGRRLWNYGIEGEDYTVVDGKPVFTDKIMKDKDGKNPLAVLRTTGAQFRFASWQDGDYELAWASEAAKKGVELYMNSGVVQEDIPQLKYTKEELKEITALDAQINAFVNEKTQQWILGVGDVEKDWDSYIARLKELGLERALEIRKAAYDRFFK